MKVSDLDPAVHERGPWNAGKIVGPKRPLKARGVWATRFFSTSTDGCVIVKMKTGDIVTAWAIRNRATERTLRLLGKFGLREVENSHAAVSQGKPYPSSRLTMSHGLVAMRALGYSHGTNVGEPRNHGAGSVYGFGRHLDGDECRWKNTGLDNFLKRCTRVKDGIFPVCLLRCACQ